MILKSISTYVLTAIVIVGCRSQEATLTPRVAQDTVKQTVNESPKEAILSALRGGGQSAFLELRGQCVDASSVSYALRVNTSEHGAKDTIENLRALLADNPGLNISKDGDGIVDIFSQNLDRGLLQTRMERVELSEMAQYNPNDALLAALGTKEVRDYMSKHGISLAPQFNGLRAGPSPNSPTCLLTSMIFRLSSSRSKY